MAEAAGGRVCRGAGRLRAGFCRGISARARGRQRRPGDGRGVCQRIPVRFGVGGAGLPVLARPEVSAPMRAGTSLLRLWLLGTLLILVGISIWAFAPVLIFLALLTGGLGLLSLAMVGLARGLERGLDKGRQRRSGDRG